MEKTIKFLHNSEIDIEKWDVIVLNAVNSRIYAESWYLDIIEPDWKGLIFGNYEYVMPVIAKSKFGICYAFQPTYTQQHGIFPTSTPDITGLFIDKLKELYPYFNISLNAFNVSVKSIVEVQIRKNFILSLNYNFSFIQSKFNTHAKRNIRKANKQCEVSNLITMDEYINLKSKFSQKGFTNDKKQKLKLIILKSLQNNKGVIYGAYTKQNELCAAAFFLKEEKRFTYLNSVSSPQGKSLRAMYAIIEKFISDYAGQPFLLDFEGSIIEGIARFFKGFGAEPETYQHIQYNNLPWFLKLIKR